VDPEIDLLRRLGFRQQVFHPDGDVKCSRGRIGRDLNSPTYLRHPVLVLRVERTRDFARRTLDDRYAGWILCLDLVCQADLVPFSRGYAVIGALEAKEDGSARRESVLKRHRRPVLVLAQLDILQRERARILLLTGGQARYREKKGDDSHPSTS